MLCLEAKEELLRLFFLSHDDFGFHSLLWWHELISYLKRIGLTLDILCQVVYQYTNKADQNEGSHDTPKGRTSLEVH